MFDLGLLTAAAKEPTTTDTLISFLPLIALFVIFYFLLIRPQQKKNKERVLMLDALKVGDQVTTIGGLHGTVVDLQEEKVVLKAADKVQLTFEKSAINNIVSKTEA